MKIKRLLVFISICIIAAVSQSTITSIIGDSNAAFIDGGMSLTDKNFGRRIVVEVGPTRVGLVRFSKIFERDGGPVPDNAEIINATFTVTTGDVILDAAIFEATKLWDEDTVTWDNYGLISTSPDLFITDIKYVDSHVVHANVTSYFQNLVATNFTNDFGWSFLQNLGLSSFNSNDNTLESTRPSLSVEWRCNDQDGCTRDCFVGNLKCQCSLNSTVYDCPDVLDGTVTLPQGEITWTNAFKTTNSSIIVFNIDTTVVFESCHDIKGTIQVNFQLGAGLEAVLLKYKSTCTISDVNVVFKGVNNDCITGRAVNRGASLVAVFGNICSGSIKTIQATILIIIAILLAVVIP